MTDLALPSFLQLTMPLFSGLTLLFLGTALRDMMQVPTRRSIMLVTLEVSMCVTAAALALSGTHTAMAISACTAGLIASFSVSLQMRSQTMRLLGGMSMFTMCMIAANSY
jgi:hypothetical protein